MPAASVAVIAGTPSAVAGILIITFGRSSRSHSSCAWAIVAVGVVREVGRHLDRDEAVGAVPLVVVRPQDVGGVGDVGGDEVPVRVGGRRAAGRDLAQLRVVVGARRHRLLEDRRVRRDAADAVLAHEIAQPAGRERAGEVVVPGALAELDQTGDGTRHDATPRAEGSD